MIQIINQNFSAWLTDDRLSRWNHIRYRSAKEDLTKEQGVQCLKYLAEYAPKELVIIMEILA
jgi:hypothetical protein